MCPDTRNTHISPDHVQQLPMLRHFCLLAGLLRVQVVESWRALRQKNANGQAEWNILHLQESKDGGLYYDILNLNQ